MFKWMKKKTDNTTSKIIVPLSNNRESLIRFVFDDTINKYENILLKQLSSMTMSELNKIANDINEHETKNNETVN